MMKIRLLAIFFCLIFFGFFIKTDVLAYETCGYGYCDTRFDCALGDTCNTTLHECCHDCQPTCPTDCGQADGCGTGRTCSSADVGDYWCGSCSTNCGSNSRTCYYTCGGSFTESCACIECVSCTPACGQTRSCGGSCSNVDNGLPTAPSILSPDGTAANPTLVANPAVQLTWSSNSSLTDYYQAEVLNSSDGVVWSSGNVSGLSATTSVLSSGVYHWHVRAVNTTCGTDTGSYSIYGYFRINSPPTLNNSPPGNYLVLQNSATVTVPPETGSRNHICQTTFTTAPAVPRRIRLVVTATDADGGSDISAVAVRLNAATTVNSAGVVTGDWNLESGVTNSVSGNNRTYVFHMSLENPLDSNTLYNLEATATDSWGATTGWVDSTRDFKAWNCRVTVSGGMFDGSAGAVCTTTTGYTTYVGDSFNFRSLRFNKVSDSSKVDMTVTRPATYNSGANYLLWGNTYNNLDTDFNYVAGDDELAGTTPLRRVSGGSLGGAYSCGAVDLTNSTMIDPYGSVNTLVVDYSSTVNQQAWWQVEGGGIRVSNTVSDLVPVTCAVDTGGCRAAMSVDDILLTNSNGLVSGASIVNNSGCGDLCRIGMADDRYYTANLLNKTYSYSLLRQEYLLKYGEGVEVSNNWGNIVLNTTDKVFFVNENLTIDSNLTLPTNQFKMVIASGTITIDPTVTRVDGIYLANTGFNINGANDTQLVIQGILHTSGGNVNISRSYVNGANNNTSPAVVIKYRPDIIFSMPANLTRALSGWKGGI